MASEMIRNLSPQIFQISSDISSITQEDRETFDYEHLPKAKRRKLEESSPSKADSSHLPQSSQQQEVISGPSDPVHVPKSSASTYLKEQLESSNLSKVQKKKEQAEKFRYGNFYRYYGNRLKGLQRDPRLDVFNKEWFQRRNVLDIGCNAGYLTLSVAKEFEPAWILGIDIDEHLVSVARHNIKHYYDGKELIGKFPASLALREEEGGPKVKKFPNNVWFRRQNYVSTMDEEIEQTQEEYDVILALSITKWVHLNWGDIGMKRFFKRAFNNLRPGGRFIVEPQDFSTYWKRAKAVEELRENCKKIEFKPEQFKDYLLNEIGFVNFEELAVSQSNAKGFERPLQVFRKAVFKETIKKVLPKK